MFERQLIFWKLYRVLLILLILLLTKFIRPFSFRQKKKKHEQENNMIHPSCLLSIIVFAFDEGERRSLFVYRTRCSNRSVCHAISRFGRHLGPVWHTLCVQFFSPGSWYLFCDSRSHMKRWRFSVYHRFVYSFFIIENLHSKIIGYLDIMLTMCFAHCICFCGFKQDQLRWIFSL